MVAAALRGRADPLLLRKAADALAVLVAVSLPWSTSATLICAVPWIVACIASLKLAQLRDELARPPGGLAALLGALGVLGMLWADAPWAERLGGVDTFVRLLLIPLALAQFRGTQRGRYVLAGFFASCTVLLAVSLALVAWPGLGKGWGRGVVGVPVKDYIAQSGEFVLCAFALGPVVVSAARARRWALAAGLGVLALAFLADVFYIAAGRTSFVVALVLVVVFCLRQFSWRGALVGLAAAGIVGAAVWGSSPYMRMRVGSLFQEIRLYQTARATTSAGERLEYWKKSIGFIAQAPLFGHGTGSIPELFRRAIVGEKGPAAEASTNPHNQTFTVALQLGLLGTALLYAMWIAHLLLFRGPRLAAWIGLVVVVENIVGSLFNSYLFDFTEAWIYIFGVGAAGGMMLPEIAREGRASNPVREPDPAPADPTLQGHAAAGVAKKITDRDRRPRQRRSTPWRRP
jgi:O-antigen ligase